MELTKTSGSLGHLSYCSNIHPGESWDEVKQNLESHIPAIKMALSPDAPFGIGLRLSAAAVEELNSNCFLSKTTATYLLSTAFHMALFTELESRRTCIFLIGKTLKECVIRINWQIHLQRFFPLA